MIKTFEEYKNESWDWFITVETKEVGTTKYYRFNGDEKEVESYAKSKSEENIEKNSNIVYRKIDDIIEEEDVEKDEAINIQNKEKQDNLFYTIEEYNSDLHDKYFK